MLNEHDEAHSSVFLHLYRSLGLPFEAFDRSLQAKAKERQQIVVVTLGLSGNDDCTRFCKQVFSNEAVRNQLKEHFISCVVDAQLRPDLAHQFQNAARLLQQPLSTPLNLFLTPDLEVFFATGALPATAQAGRPGFLELLAHIQRMWREDPEALRRQGNELRKGLVQLERDGRLGNASTQPCRQAYRTLRSLFDQGHGGFGTGAKKPQPALLNFLLEYGFQTESDATAMALATLDEMAKGAVYDQLAGGFFCRTRDAAWQQPSFEKNLADNAALVLTYCSAYQLTGQPAYRRIVRETLNFIQTQLQSAGGGFFSGTYALADDKKQQPAGAHYFFTQKQLDQVLGKKSAQIASLFYEIGHNLKDEERSLPTARVLLKNVSKQLGYPEALVAETMTQVRERLADVRAEKNPDGVNDLIIASDNARLLSALCKAATVFDDAELKQKATSLKDFLVEQWLRDDGRVPHLFTADDENSVSPYYLLDAALFAQALLDYATNFHEPKALQISEKIFDKLLEDFRSENSKVLRECIFEETQPQLIEQWQVNRGVASGNAVAILLGFCLSRQLHSQEKWSRSERLLQANAFLLRKAPHAHPLLLCAQLNALSPFLRFELPQKAATAQAENMEQEESSEDNHRMLLAQIHSQYLPHSMWDITTDTEQEKLKSTESKNSLTYSLLAPGLVSEEIAPNPTLKPFQRRTLHTPEQWHDELPDLLKAMKNARVVEKAGSLIQGKASPDATRRHTKSFASTNALGSFSVSSLAMGTHRMGLDIAEHETALSHALRSGINLVDTSPTFAFGDAERLVGRVVNELQEENPKLRSSIVIMTKLGVLLGEEAERLDNRRQDKDSLRWTVPLKSDASQQDTSLSSGAFSLDPSVPAAQFESSRQRLGVETIDGLFIQSPEHLLDHGYSQQEVLKALTEAFVFLKSLKDEDKLQFMGVLCTTLIRRGRDTSSHELSLDTLVAAKKAAGLNDEDLFCIALPINLGEKDALAPTSYERKHAGLAEEINAAKMQLIATRPLSVVTPEALFRLKEPGQSPDGARAADLNSARYRVASLEAEFDTTFAAALRIAGLASQGPVLNMSTQLGPTLEKSASLQQFELAETTLVSPRLREILGGLDQAHQGPERAKYLKFRERYIQAIGAYLASIREGAREKNQAFIRSLMPNVNLEANDQQQGDQVVQHALRMLQSESLITSTLVGLRKKEYVDEALALLNDPTDEPN